MSQPSNRYNGGQILSRPGQLVKANGQGRNSGYEQIIYLTTGDGAMKLNESTRLAADCIPLYERRSMLSI